MYTIRPMHAEDNAAFLSVIQQCVLEYGYTHSPYVVNAEDERDIFGAFISENSAIYVITDAANNIHGGGGFAPVSGAENICEIKKVYFSPRVRGLGMGKKLVTQLMQEAALQHYTMLYIETVPEMETAVALYEKLGFTHCKRKSTTGHGCCSVFMQRPIN
ncbi:MAG: GNAT family N-acetyltransferase [Alphaproteobacteria bacterium]|nr:GNAT family N-acetyltransferase [Alphaproteobacteria bacterium]